MKILHTFSGLIGHFKKGRGIVADLFNFKGIDIGLWNNERCVRLATFVLGLDVHIDVIDIETGSRPLES